MPLVFIVDRDLPEEIHTLTLSYTLYDQERMGEEPKDAKQVSTTTTKMTNNG